MKLPLLIADIEMKIKLLEEGIAEGKKITLDKIKEIGSRNYNNTEKYLVDVSELEKKIEKE